MIWYARVMDELQKDKDRKTWQWVCEQAREAMLLQTTADTLEWDERTGMPPSAGDYRAKQVALLRGEVHRRRTDELLGNAIDVLCEATKDLPANGIVAASVRGLSRDYKRNRCLPTDLVKRTAEATVRGQQLWDKARKADDYSIFQDALDGVIELKREAGDRISDGTDRSCYEALLDEYEPGASVASLQTAFDELRKPLVKLIASIKDSANPPDTKSLEQNFDTDAQRRFSRTIAEAVGFDFNRGRLDETSHPFCTTLGPSDIRILTRFENNWLPSGLYGTLHEAGHGMYEQGLVQDWFGLPAGSYVSLGIHESQSRLWENQVGRSEAFCQWMHPRAQSTFTPLLDSVDAKSLYQSVNTIRPSLIRVEADEATYNLHILIRFDLERQLIEGSLHADELPEAWNDRYQSDLGVVAPSDADGVLQDVHWSAGLIGYFPTYTLGNLASAQIFETAEKQIPDLHDQIRNGEFGGLLEWLGTHVHQHGACYTGSELIENLSGEPLSAAPLMRYLTDKLTPIYGLK